VSTTTSNAVQSGRSGASSPPGLGKGGPGLRTAEPPKQRRPALAALALVLIVGGALIAALVAVRMDSREPVLVAAHDIAPGTKISAADLTTASVASGSVPVITKSQASQIIGRTYARGQIRAGSLIDQNMLTSTAPIAQGRAEVSVSLDSSLAPAGVLTGGDLVQVVRTSGQGGSGSSGGGDPEVITQALVLSVASSGSNGALGGSGTSSSTATLLVPSSAAAAVIDASGAKAAGIALLARGQSTDVDLKVGR